MKAILINPRDLSITEVEVNAGSAEDLSRLLRCRWVYPAQMGNHDVIYANAVDTGRPFWIFRPSLAFCNGSMSQYHGMAVLTGVDDMGHAVDTTYTIEQVKAIVKFTCPVEENS